MLFFIKVQRLHNLAAKKFKYISCYSLSGGFYPLDCMAGQFKYISCYSLSNHAKQLDWYPGAFKYISCYSLSNLVHTQHQYFVDLNTSHVILYQLWEMGRIQQSTYLNTSHVILYPAYLSHFLTVILLQPLYLSGFLLYFTTLDPLFQFLP